MNSTQQKIDLQLGDLSINIDPVLVRTFVSLSGSITKQENVKLNFVLFFIKDFFCLVKTKRRKREN